MRDECKTHSRDDGSYWLYDGHGYALCRACPQCEREKLSKYRPDIMDNYVPDEPLEED